MTGYFLSGDADEDLQDIYDYTERTWGERQAERYVFALYETFDLLVSNPEAGRSRSDIRDGLRSFPYRSHIVFYMRWQDEIAVVRILNGARDHQRLFDDDDPIPGIIRKRSD